MDYVIPILLFTIGIFLIVKGGDYFVDASTWLAEVSGIPKFLIGATIVSFATTLPELLVSVFAAAKDQVEMSIGNAIGSVTANTGLIMGISIVCIPSMIRRKDYILKSFLMLMSATIIVVFGAKDIIFFGENQGSFSLTSSFLLIIIFIIAIIENILSASKAIGENSSERIKIEKLSAFFNAVKFLFGALSIIVGAELLVDYGQKIAYWFGDDVTYRRIIGVTFIAIGTSLPELVTTVSAISKNQASLSVGNIIGANIIDLTFILPISSLVYGQNLPVNKTVALVDLPACLIIGIVSLLPTIITKKFSRVQGIILLTLYAFYIVITCTL